MAIVMAVLVLFVSAGWNVNFHYCTEDEHLVSSFGNASQLCEHCQNHPHRHMDTKEYADHLNALHFDEKCCCDDFASKIQFSDDFTFSPEKQLPIFLNFIIIPYFNIEKVTVATRCIARILSPQKIPNFPSGRERAVFFSKLRLNPPVF